MPSATLLGQSVLSGLFTGALYALMGIGLGLTWGYLKLINLAHFALIFLAAFLIYQLVGVDGWSPWLAVALVLPLFFLAGVLQQALFQRFRVSEFASLLVSFGIAIFIEAGIQWIWTADAKHWPGSAHAPFRLGPLYAPYDESWMLAAAVVLCAGAWVVLRFTYLGKAIRAGAENPEIACAFGVDTRLLAYLIAGAGAASAALAGFFVALVFSFAPSQIFARMGVVFAVVMLGGLTNPLGVLAAAMVIGISEALTMAVTSPSWAPLVSFTLLIAVLLARPGRL